MGLLDVGGASGWVGPNVGGALKGAGLKRGWSHRRERGWEGVGLIKECGGARSGRGLQVGGAWKEGGAWEGAGLMKG